MEIFGVKISKVYYDEFFEKIKEPKEKMSIFTPNGEFLLNARYDENYKDILNKSDYNVPDGIGIWAAYQILDNKMGKLLNALLIPWYGLNLFIKRKQLYEKYGGRVLGSVLTKDLVEYANLKGYGITIIDKFQAPGNLGDNLKIKRQKVMSGDLMKKYPNVAFHHYIYKKEDQEKIISEINKTNDIYLFSIQGRDVGQEKTIIELLPKLDKIKVAIGVGGSFDYLLGFKKRPPKIIAILGLEWLWRLGTHPVRMAKRIWNVLPVFLYEVVKSK
ncbi:MAG: WecB/TagA/CpsF family glycosyltransferase [Candidatus Gracilibacteria bacterium]|nr:WecB/TagA/CpsF family glycosyltransferase [Candidatus Gracilibacteria bacterium]